MSGGSPFQFLIDCLKQKVFEVNAEGKPVRNGRDFVFVDNALTFKKLDRIHRRHGIVVTPDHVRTVTCSCGEHPKWMRAENLYRCVCGEESEVVAKDYGREVYRMMEANRLFRRKRDGLEVI